MKNLKHFLKFFVYRYYQLILPISFYRIELHKAKNRIIDDLIERIFKSQKDKHTNIFIHRRNNEHIGE